MIPIISLSHSTTYAALAELVLGCFLGTFGTTDRGRKFETVSELLGLPLSGRRLVFDHSVEIVH
jgi:hypothetical protein